MEPVKLYLFKFLTFSELHTLNQVCKSLKTFDCNNNMWLEAHSEIPFVKRYPTTKILVEAKIVIKQQLIEASKTHYYFLPNLFNEEDYYFYRELMAKRVSFDELLSIDCLLAFNIFRKPSPLHYALEFVIQKKTTLQELNQVSRTTLFYIFSIYRRNPSIDPNLQYHVKMFQENRGEWVKLYHL